MGMKKYSPTTASRRFMSVVTRDEITKQVPEKSLVEGVKKRTGGRNSIGQISSRFRGGGAKQAYRTIDFKRDKIGIPAKVASIEYDPNRSARIALLNYADGEKRYIICPVGLTVGRTVTFGRGSGHPGGQRPAAAEYSSRHGGPQCGTSSGQGCANGALGRRPGAVGIARKRHRAVEAAVGRNPQSASGMHGDGRPGGQRGAREREPRESRKVALARQKAAQSRRFDESGGSSAWRRRRQDGGRTASGDAVGPADARIQDAQQQADG